MLCWHNITWDPCFDNGLVDEDEEAVASRLVCSNSLRALSFRSSVLESRGFGIDLITSISSSAVPAITSNEGT